MLNDQPVKVLGSPDQLKAIKTWRYLRVAMVGLAVGLGICVLYERTQADCLLGSISAYYYTPVQSMFVGALLAMGVSLICLKGNTDLEDMLLNVAGMLATVVALVPTPNIGSCGSVLGTTRYRDVNIENNVFGLLVVAFAVLLFLVTLDVLHAAQRTDASDPPLEPEGTTLDVVGYVVAFGILTFGAVAFFAYREWFSDNVHNIAAITLFVCIVAVVVLNAIGYRDAEGGRLLTNRYSVIAVLMVLAFLVCLAAWQAGSERWVLWLEASELVLFGVFWSFQTVELWNRGLR